MRKLWRNVSPLIGLLCWTSLVQAKPPTPLEETAFDGGAPSAESLGRGRTFTGNRATMAAGSENPAALIVSLKPAAYFSFQAKQGSDLPKGTVRHNDPIEGKNLHYLSMGSDKAVVYYEPVGRREEHDFQVDQSTSHSRDVDFSADAIGFAAAERWKKGVMGISLAYLRASLASTDRVSGLPDHSALDTADGVRLNLGAHYQTGPAIWGVTVQNFPGMLWWKNHKRDVLPMKTREGATFRIQSGLLFSAEHETRFYSEGSHKKDFLYFGTEAWTSEYFILRAGVFGEQVDKKENRHVTGGLTFKTKSGVELSGAIERYQLLEHKVTEILISMQIPVVAAD